MTFKLDSRLDCISFLFRESWKDIGPPKLRKPSAILRNVSGNIIKTDGEFRCLFIFKIKSYET